MNYDVNYFIQKFEAIPEDKWARFTQLDDDGSRCALGWCDGREKFLYRSEIAGDQTKEGEGLIRLFLYAKIYFGNDSLKSHGVASVNNGTHAKYPQPTPKQRILAALYDIKKMQEPKHTDITKQIAVLPVNETSDLITTNILQ